MNRQTSWVAHCHGHGDWRTEAVMRQCGFAPWSAWHVLFLPASPTWHRYGNCTIPVDPVRLHGERRECPLFGPVEHTPQSHQCLGTWAFRSHICDVPDSWAACTCPIDTYPRHPQGKCGASTTPEPGAVLRLVWRFGCVPWTPDSSSTTRTSLRRFCFEQAVCPFPGMYAIPIRTSVAGPDIGNW